MGVLVDLGASGLKEGSNLPWAQCKDAPIDDEDGPGWDDAPVMCALGVSARPYPATAEGAAVGVVDDKVGGYEGVLVAAYDPRVSKVFGKIKEGDTVLHGTGPDHESQVLCKEQMVAIMVGDDHVVQIDRKNKRIIIAGPGGQVRVSSADGVVLADSSGKSSLQLKGGFSALLGQVVLGGRRPVSNVADAKKIMVELQKIAATIASLPPPPPPQPKPVYIPNPKGVGADGVFLGK
jgi:hypothetical protein